MVDLRKEARGRECQVRIPGHCNHDPTTVVLAHINLPGVGGMGMKAPDLLAAWCCSACHDVVDGRVKSSYFKHEIRMMFYEGVFRTQNALIKLGKV